MSEHLDLNAIERKEIVLYPSARRHKLPPLAICFTDLPRDKQNRQIWTCVVCGKRDAWDRKWSVYGSVMEQEEGYCVPTCSNACRERYDEIRREA